MSDHVAVIDSGPLIALANVGQLEVLRRMFVSVLVPGAVVREVVQAGATAFAGRAPASRRPKRRHL